MNKLISFITFFLLQLSSNLFAYDACDQPPSKYNCDFYSHCLEENYKCQKTDYRYPIEYGDRFCRNFERSSYQLTRNGVKWMNRTMLCLQNFLYDNFLLNTVEQILSPNKTCKKISLDAFSSHHRCYIKPTGSMKDGICPLWRDYKTIFKTGKPWQAFGTKYSRAVRKQIHQTATSCMAYWIGFRRSKNRPQDAPFDKILKELEEIVIENTDKTL